MGASKKNLYSDYINEVASIAKVFAHPARVAIIKHISKQTGCICNDLVDEIGLSQPTISQHLSVISDAGLLKGTYEGKKRCFCLNVERLDEFKTMLGSFMHTAKLNCC